MQSMLEPLLYYSMFAIIHFTAIQKVLLVPPARIPDFKTGCLFTNVSLVSFSTSNVNFVTSTLLKYGAVGSFHMSMSASDNKYYSEIISSYSSYINNYDRFREFYIIYNFVISF